MQTTTNSMKKSKSAKKDEGGARKVFFNKMNGTTYVTTGSVDLHGSGAKLEDVVNGHGYIKIAESVLKEAVAKGLVDKDYGAKGNNVFYICKPNRFFNFYSNRVLIHCDPISSSYGAYQVMDNTKMNLKLLKAFRVYLGKSKGEKLGPGRHYSKVTINSITMQAALAIKWVNEKIASIENLEAHHVYGSWDMRDEAIKCLTPAQHDQEHHKTSAQSHTIIVHIGTLNELIAFMNWLETEDYRGLFSSIR